MIDGALRHRLSSRGEDTRQIVERAVYASAVDLEGRDIHHVIRRKIAVTLTFALHNARE